MEMCLKLAYCAFSSSPSKDSTMSSLWGFLLHYLFKFKPLDDFSLPKRDCKSLCVWLECVCVHPHPLNKDFSQAVIGTFYQYHFQKIVGWVAFKFFFFILKFKLFKMCRPLPLFILLRFLLSVWKVIPYRKGMSCGMCSLKITTSKGILYSLGQLERLYDAISDKNKT